MSLQDKELYYVAVKVFLEKDEQLFIFKDKFGDWDLPGGRIRKDEFAVPLEQVIRRKISEELGDTVEYTLGKPIVCMRHERVESEPGNPTIRIFSIGYEARYVGGDVHLSELHTEMKWVPIDNSRPEEYFTGGWLKGVQEYLSIRKNR